MAIQFSPKLTPTVLVREERLPDVRSDVVHARDRGELLLLRRDDPPLLGRDVPGFVMMWLRKSRSLNSGMSDWPRNGTTATPRPR
jgi:hypothetical protein